MTPSIPTICVICRFSTKSIVFQKMFQMSLTAKEVDHIFEEQLNCWLAFFLYRCGLQEKIEPSWRKYLIWKSCWAGEHNIPATQNMFPFHLVQSANTEFLLIKTHRVFNRSNNQENPNTKKFNKVLWWALWVEDLEIFTAAFLLKTIIWTCICFKYCRVFSLKTEKKPSRERCKTSKNSLT